jgi:enoyl-CoA hydratase
MSYKNILTEKHGAVALVRLNRPEVLNALNDVLVTELAAAVDEYEFDDSVGAIVVTGNEKAFAAGADISQMVDRNYADMYVSNRMTNTWVRIAECRKPVIAAVAGYALGGGCELAMMCDIIVCADNARFGQPEIKLGVLPGIGGTQRLTRAVGKSKAMDMCLSARMMDAEEAERSGLVSRVVPAAELLEQSLALAAEIAAKSRPALYMVKEAINQAYETTLTEGLRVERQLFHSSFAMEDQAEGMRAFLEKRDPRWGHR